MDVPRASTTRSTNRVKKTETLLAGINRACSTHPLTPFPVRAARIFSFARQRRTAIWPLQ